MNRDRVHLLDLLESARMALAYVPEVSEDEFLKPKVEPALSVDALTVEPKLRIARKRSEHRRQPT